MPHKTGNSEVYRSFPLDLNFAYGSLSWSYIDVYVTSEKEVHTIYLVASYESIENAKQQFTVWVSVWVNAPGAVTVFLVFVTQLG